MKVTMKCHTTYSPHLTASTSLAGQSLMNSQICRWLTQPPWRQGKAEPLSYRERSWFSLSKGKRRMKLWDELAERICSFMCISLHMYGLRKCPLGDKRYLPVLFTTQFLSSMRFPDCLGFHGDQIHYSFFFHAHIVFCCLCYLQIVNFLFYFY